MRFSAHVDEHGTLNFYDLVRLGDWMFKHKGQRIEVELRDEAAIRSNGQNRFLHGPVMAEFARVWFADGWRHVISGQAQEMPRWMVRERVLGTFCPRHAVESPGGEIKLVRRSSADLKRAEFSAMLDEMAEYLVHKDGERGVLPSPEEWQGGEG